MTIEIKEATINDINNGLLDVFIEGYNGNAPDIVAQCSGHPACRCDWRCHCIRLDVFLRKAPVHCDHDPVCQQKLVFTRGRKLFHILRPFHRYSG